MSHASELLFSLGQATDWPEGGKKENSLRDRRATDRGGRSMQGREGGRERERKDKREEHSSTAQREKESSQCRSLQGREGGEGGGAKSTAKRHKRNEAQMSNRRGTNTESVSGASARLLLAAEGESARVQRLTSPKQAQAFARHLLHRESSHSTPARPSFGGCSPATHSRSSFAEVLRCEGRQSPLRLDSLCNCRNESDNESDISFRHPLAPQEATLAG